VAVTAGKNNFPLPLFRSLLPSLLLTGVCSHGSWDHTLKDVGADPSLNPGGLVEGGQAVHTVCLMQPLHDITASVGAALPFMWEVHGTPCSAWLKRPRKALPQEFQVTGTSALRENGEESREGIHTHDPM